MTFGPDDAMTFDLVVLGGRPRLLPRSSHPHLFVAQSVRVCIGAVVALGNSDVWRDKASGVVVVYYSTSIVHRGRFFRIEDWDWALETLSP